MRFLNYDNAVKNAQDRADRTEWQFSVRQRYNPHLRDYEFEVVAFTWSDALYVAYPKNWSL